ncbi:MAG TPA: aldehyde ferredoxin oxidoreductase [Desulfosporosinus sp.]|nr:aldehyde ferredoxin oxidoreductase [Desulfosporosinus sp.]
MNNGYWNKALRVNLTTEKITVDYVDDEAFKNFIGGAGIAAKVLLEETAGKINPLGEENKLVFACGPFQGPTIPGGAKWTLAAKSPLTGTWGESGAGADFGPGLKDAGYDFLVIEGKAQKPVYLKIVDDSVEICDAAGIWGLDSYQTFDEIQKRENNNKLSIATIGPAGEKMVTLACVVVDKHSFAGRTGIGAVFGSKNLKAVAVQGTKSVPLHNPEELKKLSVKYSKLIHSAGKENGFREHGTPGMCTPVEAVGDMPIKNWSGDVWTEGAAKIGAPNYTNVLNAKPLPCKYCPLGCHRHIKITEPTEYAQEGIGPEYETLGMLGSNCLIDDPKAIAMGNDICNRLGIDTISAGACISFSMECFEKGWLNIQQTDGLELKWGDAEVMLELLKQIGNKEGFGAIFAEGALRAASKIHPDSVERVAHVKGLDLAAHDARANFSLAINYATSTRGACHMRGMPEDVEMGGFFIPELGITEDTTEFFKDENKTMLAVKLQDFATLLNSLVLCDFMIDGAEMPFQASLDIFNAVTGWDYTIEDYMKAGTRIFTAQRLINLRDGFDAKSDTLPKVMFEPAKEGFRAGKVPNLEVYLKEYYEMRGWDENGYVSKAVLDELGLANFKLEKEAI